MVSTPAVGKHETIAKSDRQEKDVTYNMRFVRERLLEAFNRPRRSDGQPLDGPDVGHLPDRASLH